MLVMAHNPRLLQQLMAANLGDPLPEDEERAKWDALVVRHYSVFPRDGLPQLCPLVA
jgi:hypothetical protein